MEQQCFAPDEDGTRCSNTRAGTSFHCEYHSSILKPLYLKFKNILVDDWIDLKVSELEEHTIEKLLLILARIEKVYNLRSEYRAKSFVPTVWDRGHDRYIELCIRQVFRIRKVLVNKFNTVTEENEQESDEASTSEVNSLHNIENSTSEVNVACGNIQKLCKQVIETEAKWEDSDAIRENNLGKDKLDICYRVLQSMITKQFGAQSSESMTECFDDATMLLIHNGTRLLRSINGVGVKGYFHRRVGTKALLGKSTLPHTLFLEESVDSALELLKVCKLPEAIPSMFELFRDNTGNFRLLDYYRAELCLDEKGVKYMWVKGCSDNAASIRVYMDDVGNKLRISMTPLKF